MLKIRVKNDLCCGAQLCVQVAPGVYHVDELGYNASDGDSVPSDKEAEAKLGASSCPESAIQLEPSDG